MDALILGLPSYNTAIYDGLGCDSVVWVAGHDAPDFPGMDVELTRRRFFGLMETSHNPARGIILIRRGRSHEFYEARAKIKGSGEFRRSIPNIDDVFRAMSSRMECKMVSMEGLPLKDQIAAFRGAGLVVMQHGAAMANLVWCERGAVVVEIGTEETRHYYRRLIEMAGLAHVHIRQDHDHAPVDAVRVADAVVRKTLRL
jgi:hypothetical protein